MKRETLIWIVLLLLGGACLVYRATTSAVGNGTLNGTVYLEDFDGDGQETVATGWDAAAGTAQASVSRSIGVWIAAVFTLCIMSFLYKDNPFYKIAESVVIGVSAAYWMVVVFWTTLIPNLFGMLLPGWINSWAMPDLSAVRGNIWFLYFIPLVLGVMLLWRLAPKGTWIARWPLAFIIGTTAGIRLVGFIDADFRSQIRNSLKPVVALEADAEPTSAAEVFSNIDIWTSAMNLTLIVGVLACLVYFFFSVEHKGLPGKVSKVGVWFLMITFGAAFGYTVMGRIALLAIRLEFLCDDWLWLIDPQGVRPIGWLGWW